MSALKRLLVLSEYPPSTLAGAPVILRQLLRTYDMDRLDVLCCNNWYSGQTDVVEASYLSCPHTAISGTRSDLFRPHRVSVPLVTMWNYLRIDRIVAEGRRIIRERGVEAIFTPTCNIEFSLAASRLAEEFGLDLYVFETDDWVDANPWPLNRIKRAERAASLRAARQVWTTSPAMVRYHRRTYGVESEFLFHFVDTEHYRAAWEAAEPPEDRIVIIYTGSINLMFVETMRKFCRWLNAEVEIQGRPVEMVIYTQSEPTEYLGPRVRWGGYVPIEEVPSRIAQGHLSAILVSFEGSPSTERLIRTSLYTKTIDYLAAGSPTLVVSPPDAAEVDYFGDVTYVVDRWDPERVREAIGKLALDREVRTELRAKGFDRVEERHSMESLERLFLRYFRHPEEEAIP